MPARSSYARKGEAKARRGSIDALNNSEITRACDARLALTLPPPITITVTMHVTSYLRRANHTEPVPSMFMLIANDRAAYVLRRLGRL